VSKLIIIQKPSVLSDYGNISQENFLVYLYAL